MLCVARCAMISEAECSDSHLLCSRAADDMHKIKECLAAPALYSGQFGKLTCTYMSCYFVRYV